MRVLIPLVTKQENNVEFLNEATAKAREIILLLVIDTNLMQGEFGFASREIMQGNKLLEEVKALIGARRKTAKEIVEWGQTIRKIENIAILRQVDKIILRETGQKPLKEMAKRLARDLSKEKISVEVI